MNAEILKAKLIAAQLSYKQFLTLRNIVRVLRMSGAVLNQEQEQRVKEFEAVIASYREANG